MKIFWSCINHRPYFRLSYISIFSYCSLLAAPRILSLSAEGSETSGFKAMCHVQGSPLPDVQWIAPDGVLEGDTSFSLSQEATGQYRTSSQLLDVKPGGQYICAASNSLGKDQATLYVLPPSPERSTAKSSFSLLVLLLALALGTKLLLALGVGAWVIKRRFSSSVDHWKDTNAQIIKTLWSSKLFLVPCVLKIHGLKIKLPVLRWAIWLWLPSLSDLSG